MRADGGDRGDLGSMAYEQHGIAVRVDPPLPAVGDLAQQPDVDLAFGFSERVQKQGRGPRADPKCRSAPDAADAPATFR